jgi:hypothetical protein
MSKRITSPTITVNNYTVGIQPNTGTYREGKGEQTVSTAAAGNTIDTIYSDNAESKMSFVSFELPTTAENIELARSWKSNEDNNLISLVDTGVTRTFQKMALTNDYDVNLSSDGTIALEFMGLPAV